MLLKQKTENQRIQLSTSMTSKPKRVFSMFHSKVRSMHPTHNILRSKLPLFPFKSVIRMGSVTDVPDTITNGGNRIELNTIEAIKNSASKFRMKDCFVKGEVKTAEFYKVSEVKESIKANTWDIYPLVAKINFGSRARGMKKLDNLEQLNDFLNNTNLTGYYFEKFYNYAREYRLHVTEEGCFYTCRKMIKSDTPDELRWYKNDSNSKWMVEENPLFDKPTNWDIIVGECVKALKSVGLDVCSCDVRVQTAKTERGKLREAPDFIIVEVNSASSFGDVTAVKYLEEIPKILNKKYGLLH